MVPSVGMAKICSVHSKHHQRPITVYTPARWNEYLCERSVAVITERCQRLNPGSNPGARTKNPSQRRTAQLFGVNTFSRRWISSAVS